ncbi:hypothetical protein J8F10_26380 [Gemmata sp. G18]|uniref:Glycosyltransferase RgtA/B/C/D-like domain-containing protein n=1 Tax=Gemmata palustris TaxID=2822762 RepID=A0ABS5BYL2_9BACT|nr:hypothetical protein [Gemmata palustris]MBP3958789.1 hypothetical protein [Gemmata palustris]
MAEIAEKGFSNSTRLNGQSGVAFQPAMPATMALAEALGCNMFWAGLVIANLLGAAGAAIFGRVAARVLDDPGAAWRAMTLLLAFPTAFFFSVAYNESFGLLFTALALAAWQKHRAVGAGLAALGGSLARLTGVALGVAAACDWITKRDRKELPRTLALVIGSAGGIVLFWGFLWWIVGDPFASLKAHTKWGRAELSWRNSLLTIESIYNPDLPHWGEAFLVLGVTVLGIRAWRKRGVFWGVLTLLPVAQMFASGTLLSGHRVVLASLPAFIELADLLRSRRSLFVAILVGFAFAQFVLLNRFVHWQFAG